MNYKQLLILKLSNLTEWKNEKEMIIPEEMRRDFDWTNTCEFLGDGIYILRGYYKSGNKYREIEHQNDQQHGLSLGWWENGQLNWRTEYQNGQRHGLDLGWYEDGRPQWEEEWKNGKRIRKDL